MKFYSEILDRLFDNQEELIKKEAEAKDVLAQEKKKQVQIKKKRAELLKEVDEKKELVQTTFEAYQRADAAFKAAVRKIKQFDNENSFDLDDFESIFDAVLDITNF